MEYVYSLHFPEDYKMCIVHCIVNLARIFLAIYFACLYIDQKQGLRISGTDIRIWLNYSITLYMGYISLWWLLAEGPNIYIFPLTCGDDMVDVVYVGDKLCIRFIVGVGPSFIDRWGDGLCQKDDVLLKRLLEPTSCCFYSDEIFCSNFHFWGFVRYTISRSIHGYCRNIIWIFFCNVDYDIALPFVVGFGSMPLTLTTISKKLDA